MNNRDFLLQVAVRADNATLELLSRTSAWNLIRDFADGQHFWYLRTEYLVGRDLAPRIGQQASWKKVYYILEDALKKSNPFTDNVLRNKISLEVLLELYYNPAVDDNHALRRAAGEGWHEAVTILLQDPRTDPTVGRSWLITNAAQLGHTEVFELLLRDGRANPAMNDNWAIVRASMRGHSRIVELLLEDRRADPTAHNSSAIRSSCSGGYVDVVKLLLKDGRADPTADNNFCLGVAQEHKNNVMISLLLQDDRVIEYIAQHDTDD